MTVEVERTYDVAAPLSQVWERLASEENRATAISIVSSFEPDGEETIWQVQLPGPLKSRTMAVRTRDIELDPPRFVKFVGESKVLDVTGEHELTERDGGTRVRTRFVVDGHLPGVERFFKRNIDDEIANVISSVSADVTPVEGSEA